MIETTGRGTETDQAVQYNQTVDIFQSFTAQSLDKTTPLKGKLEEWLSNFMLDLNYGKTLKKYQFKLPKKKQFNKTATVPLNQSSKHQDQNN